MKKVRNTIALIALALFVTAFTTKTMDTTAYDPSGVWDYEVETPEGTQTGEMTIEKNKGDYEVTIESSVYGTLELSKVKLDKQNMVGELDLQGNSLDFDMDFDGDSMEGIIYMGETELEISAERQKKK